MGSSPIHSAKILKMKKIITILTLGLLVSSCATDKYLLTEDELKNFSVKGDTILYKSVPVAVYTHWEYELNPSHGKKAKPIIELSIKSLSVNTLFTLFYFFVVPPRIELGIRA